MMIDAAEHHDADAVFAFQLVECLARLPAYLGLALVQGFEAGGKSSLIFLACYSEYRPPRLEHLVGANLSSRRFKIGSI